MKSLAAALFASCLMVAGCAESLGDVALDFADGGAEATSDSSSNKDSGATDSGSIDTTTVDTESDTGGDDTASIDDTEFPDFGGGGGDSGFGFDSGGFDFDSGFGFDSGGFGFDGGGFDGGGGSCTKKEDCPGGCCDTSKGVCGFEFFGVCISF